MSTSNLSPFTSTTRPLSPSPTPPPSSSRSSSASPSDDSSIITELSFDYTLDADGNPVRLNKGSAPKFTNTSSPPTPQDSPDSAQPRDKSPPPPSPLQLEYTTKKPPSPILRNAPPRRSSLSRSESAYAVLSNGSNGTNSSASGARSFSRVASGSLSVTPASSGSFLTSGLSTGVRARRVTIEEHREQDARNRQHIEEIRARMNDAQEEKENLVNGEDPFTSEGHGHGSSLGLATTSKRSSPILSSRSASASQRATSALSTRMTTYNGSGAVRPLSDVPLPQRDHRGRIVKNVKFGASNVFDRIVEGDGTESESGVGYYTGEETDTGGEEYIPTTIIPTNSTARQRSYAGFSSSITASVNARPRRSASLSDASTQEGRLSPTENGVAVAPQQHMHLGSSSGTNARRVTIEERERQDLELKHEYKRYLRETEETNRRSKAHAYPEVHEQLDQPRQSPSPPTATARQGIQYTHKRGDSDTLRNAMEQLESPPAAEALPPRLSPSARHIQPYASASTSTAARHRRSPTAPEAQASGGLSSNAQGTGKARVGVKEEYVHVNGNGLVERERPVPSRSIHQQQVQQPQQQHHHHQQLEPVHLSNDAKNRQIVVNKKIYARLDVIGKGGSSRVYRVLSQANELYAIKRVSLDKTDAETMCGYMNEIALLKRLDGNSRIIRLIDSEVRAGPGGSKGHLLLVMECGEVDLSRILQEQQKEPMNMVWISYYWQQMLQAVHIIHEEKIVHSDLKPANFVLVRGHLKLIDFGIANAIANDTTNIQRDHQIGTVNYMSPEAIELPDGMRRLKVGRPSDVWSLGCILYQMVYGQPPFSHLSVYQKMKAIPDVAHVIDFPEFSTPSIPASRSSQHGGGTTPPKKLDHLKRRVRRDVIASMESCLSRNPKERSTIPELMEQDWLAMKEPEPPIVSIKELLTADETVINPHYMRQLLAYGIRLGQKSPHADVSSDQIDKDADRLIIELKRLEQ